MLRHVVSFQLATTDPQLRATHAREVKTRLEALRDVDSGIISLDVYFDVGDVAGHWPLILVGDFSNAQSLQNYAIDARHRRVVEW